MTPKIHSEITRIKNALVENYKPEKIILFGSYVWGKPRENSDVDLLIVKQTRKKPSERIAEAYGILPLDRDFDVDVLVDTPREILLARKRNNIFLREIETKGKVLYEK